MFFSSRPSTKWLIRIVLIALGLAAGLLPFGKAALVEASASSHVNSNAVTSYSGRRIAVPEQSEDVLYYRPSMTASTFSLTAVGNVADLGEAIEFSISGELLDDTLSGTLTSRKSPLYFQRATQNDSYNYDSEFIGVRQSGSQAACGGNPDSLCGVWDIRFTYGMEFGNEYGFVGTMNLTQQDNRVSGTMNYNLTPETEAKIGGDGDDPQNVEFIVSLHSQLVMDVSGTFVSGNPPVSQASCTPTVRGLSPQKPGDVISPGATYRDETGNEVGNVQEYWYFNGKETNSIVWDGKKVTVELQWSCPNNFGDSRSFTIPAYQESATVPPEGQPPSSPGSLAPQDIATGVGTILIGLGGIIGVGGAISAGSAIIGATLTPPAAQPPPPRSPQPGSPATPGGNLPPAASPGGGAPKSFVDSPVWDLVKTNTSAASTIAGTMSDLLKFPNSADKTQKIRDALDAWRSNPTPANADSYRNTLDNSFKGKHPGIGKVSDALGNLSKGVDVIDAIGSGMKKAAEKGLGGDDQILIIIGETGKEIIKKGITWTITKNPVVGIADAVVGGVTQGIWGKDNRIDLGAGVDKVAGGVFNVYDKTTSGLGRLWEKGVTDAAKSNTKNALENARRHINDQVSRGKISDTTGRSRLRRLEKIITGED